MNIAEFIEYKLSPFRIEKDKSQIMAEVADVRAATDEVTRSKASAEKSLKNLTNSLNDLFGFLRAIKFWPCSKYGATTFSVKMSLKMLKDYCSFQSHILP